MNITIASEPEDEQRFIDSELNNAYAEGREDEAKERKLKMDLLEAENERLRKRLTWLPIKTAPECVQILGYSNTWGEIFCGTYYAEAGEIHDGGGAYVVSHWMPLPEPPL